MQINILHTNSETKYEQVILLHFCMSFYYVRGIRFDTKCNKISSGLL